MIPNSRSAVPSPIPDSYKESSGIPGIMGPPTNPKLGITGDRRGSAPFSKKLTPGGVA